MSIMTAVGQIPEWYERAACAEANPETFFPERGVSPAEAKGICGRCPVRELCLAAAIASEEPVWGVWGGLTEQEMRALRQKRGIGKVGAIHPLKTHCKYDHEFTPANTGYRPSGARYCRACARDKSAARRKAAVA